MKEAVWEKKKQGEYETMLLVFSYQFFHLIFSNFSLALTGYRKAWEENDTSKVIVPRKFLSSCFLV